MAVKRLFYWNGIIFMPFLRSKKNNCPGLKFKVFGYPSYPSSSLILLVRCSFMNLARWSFYFLDSACLGLHWINLKLPFCLEPVWQEFFYYIKYLCCDEFNGFASLKCESGAAKHTWSYWGGERHWDTKYQGAHPWQKHRVSEVKWNFSSASHWTEVSSWFVTHW